MTRPESAVDQDNSDDAENSPHDEEEDDEGTRGYDSHTSPC